MAMKENLSKILEKILFGFNLKYRERVKSLSGKYWIILKDSRTGEIIKKICGNNIIVNSASVLIARLLKDSHEPDGGITYLAVGSGGDGWDLQNPPQPVNTQTRLNNEIARKAFSTEDVTFIDPDTGDPTVVPTNVVDYTATFAETEAVGPLVEMGLFGGEASSLTDSGTMINFRTFPVVNKTNSMTLTIIFRITA